MMKRKIPLKNYIILVGIAFFTLLVVLYLGIWYKTTYEYKKNTSPLESVINEISIDELNSYLIDNPNCIIYISENNDAFKEYENILKDVIIEYNLKNEIVYIYINDDNFEKIRAYYKNEPLFDNNIVVFENGVIKASLARTIEDFNKDKTIEFLIEQELIDR